MEVKMKKAIVLTIASVLAAAIYLLSNLGTAVMLAGDEDYNPPVGGGGIVLIDRFIGPSD